MKTLKTSQVCRREGWSCWTIANLIREGAIPQPVKDGSGDYHWTEQDIARAKRVIAERQSRRKTKALARSASHGE
jgi:predicted DNA-binding transcriptional regulator AlpA